MVGFSCYLQAVQNCTSPYGYNRLYYSIDEFVKINAALSVRSSIVLTSRINTKHLCLSIVGSL